MSYIQNFFTSRDNNANAETFVGQEGRLWWDPVTNQIYSSDGNTPGGIPLTGGGGGNGTPGGSNSQVQFNQNGTFGGTANVTINSVNGQLSTVSLSASGNVTGNYILGNGSQLTGLSATYGNANVATFLADFGSNVISTTGNVTGGNLLTGGVVEFAGGSRLRPIGANLDIVAGAGSYVNLITSDDSSYMGVDGAGGYVVAAGRSWRFNTDGTTTFPNNNINTGANPITLWSTDSSSLLWRDAAGGAPSQPVQTIIEAGNGAATITVSTGVLAIQSQKIWTFDTAGNTTFPDATVQTTAYPGNATTLSLSGNITGSYILGNGSQLTGLPATYGNTNVATLLAAFGSNTVVTTGNITGGNLNATGLSLSGNVVSAINTVANITTTANITGGNVIGTTSVAVDGTGGNLTMTGGAITGAGSITSTGNITGGNLITAGLISASGNITGGNILGGANVNATTHTGTTVSVTGNITGGNVLSNGQLSAAGNITGARLALGGDITTPGNIGASYINGAYYTGTWSTNFQAIGNISTVANVISGNIVTSGLISATGNITGGNILGGANVNSTLFTGTTVSVTGNITGGNVIATTTVYGNAATAFVAGNAAISGVALQMPSEGALRNLTNGLTNMYFDVSIGGSTNGQFQFRSSSSFTNVLTMSPTAFNINTEAVVTAKTASFGRLPWNSAIDTELTIDDYRWRITNSGGIYAQVISNTGGTKNSAWTAVAAISGSAITQGGSTGILLPNNSWTTLYTFGSMASAGDTVTVTFQDKTQGRIYRVTFMRSDNGSTTGYNIIAERLI